MHRIWAIIERDLRRFRRSPVLVVISIVMPLVQLMVLGYAFGGKVKNLRGRRGGRGPRRAGRQVAGNVPGRGRQRPDVHHRRLTPTRRRRCRICANGKISGVLDIPPEFSRKVLAGANPRIALIEDNTDQFAASALEGSMNGMMAGLQRAGRAGADDGGRHAVRRGGLSLRAVHPVSAAGRHRAGDLCLGDDRRRHHLH